MSDDADDSEPVGTPPTTPQSKIRSRSHQVVQRRQEAAKQRYAGSSAEHLWTRLGAMDFINRGMLFAAILLLCLFPFLIIANALAGRSAAAGLARHLGLNQEAAADVGKLFTSTTATSNAVTGTGYVFFLLGAIAVAASIEELYEGAFELDRREMKDRGVMKDLLRRFLWVGVLIVGSLLAGWAGPAISNTGGPVLLGTLAFVFLTAFWWFTLWLLLSRSVAWRRLLPSAIATALCWIGMEVVFSYIFSSTIISDNNKYGPIGVVFALMSWLIAIGVVIILGAVVGIVWDERKLSFSTPFKALMRRRSRS